MNTIHRWVRTVQCFLAPSCNPFDGDEFTRWLEAQQQAAQRANADLVARRQQPTGNPFEQAVFPPRQRRTTTMKEDHDG